MEPIIEELLQFKLFGAWGSLAERELLTDYFMAFLQGNSDLQAFWNSDELSSYNRLFCRLKDSSEMEALAEKYPELRAEMVREFLSRQYNLFQWNFLPEKLQHALVLPAFLLPAAQASVLLRIGGLLSKIKRWIRRLLRPLAHSMGQLASAGRQKKKNRAFKQKLSEYDQLMRKLAPFQAMLGWAAQKGEWKRGLHLLDKSENFKSQDKHLKALSGLLGQLQRTEKKLKMEKLEQVAASFAPAASEHSPEEIAAVRFSNEISQVLPSELALLGNEQTEALFYQKYSEKQLLSFQYEGNQEAIRQTITPNEKSVSQNKRGPIVLCVDSSASMIGKTELLAKAVSFSVLRHALEEDRKCYLISFSEQIAEAELTDRKKGTEHLIELLSGSFHGGTSLLAPLERALELLQQPDYQKADLLIITDGQHPKLQEKTIRNIRMAQQRKNRFFHMAIAGHAYKPSQRIFDEDWHVHPAQPDSLKEIVLRLQKFKKRQ
ncbi:MAG: VWA domain-containing protein [Cytophagales bacterium]|nr:VWA domain-containing protein [Cytophagales bacterium]